MTTHPPDQSAISRTFEIAQENSGFVALWCGLSVATELVFLADSLVFYCIWIVVQVIFSYYFYSSLLNKSGYKSDQANIGRFFVLSLMLGLSIGLGMLLLIIPGVILYLRLLVAIPILMSEGNSSLDAMSESWERTRGKAGQIFVSLLPALGLTIVSLVWFGVASEENFGSLVVPAVIGGLGGALFLCCSIAVYEGLSASRAQRVTRPTI